MDAVSFIPFDQRVALSVGGIVSGPVQGAVLVADLASSTRLVEALVEARGPQGGVEALGRILNDLFSVLIGHVKNHRGSVTNFGGDAITAWFASPGELSALQCALDIQRDPRARQTVALRGGESLEVGFKVAVAAGQAHRFVVGDPEIQRLDLILGGPAARAAEMERRCPPGAVVVDDALLALAPLRIEAARSAEIDGVGRMTEVSELRVPVLPRPWDTGPVVPAEVARAWVHAEVRRRLESLDAAFLDELRTPGIVFVRFDAGDLGQDARAGERLDAFVRWAQGVFERYEGLLLQVLVGRAGCYLYGSFGALRSHEDDAERAVEAALTLVAPPPELGFAQAPAAGVARGPVYAGAYGAVARRTYGVLGDNVHVASRLMDAAAPGQVLVTGAVRAEADRSFRFEDAGERVLRGVARPMRAWAAMRGAGAAEVLPGEADPMLGREDESVVLSACIEEACQGRGGCVVLEGEAGMGKSRLVLEVAAQARDRGARVLIGAGDSIVQASSYNAWRPVVASLIGTAGADSAGVLQALEALGVPADRAALLNPLLAVALPETDLLRQMPGEVRAASTRAMVVDLLAREASRHPLVVILEDVHWLDASSWTLFHEAHRALSRVFLLATTRPPEGGAAVELRRALEMPGTRHRVLRRLDEEAIDRLALGRLGAELLAPEVRDLVRDRCQGNPFVARELVLDLRESGRVVLDRGVARLAAGAGPAESSVPRSIQDVLTSRLDRLSPDLQGLLKVASVVGRVFPATAILDVIGPHSDAGAVLRGLADLATLGLLEAPGTGPGRYAFRHVLIRDTVYGTLLEAQRRVLHASVAQWWEVHPGAQGSLDLALLAHHWERAGDRERAMGYLDRAGDRALRDFANDEAAAIFQRALAILGVDGVERDRRARWELGLGIARVNLLRYDEATPHLEEGLVLLGHDVPRGPVRTTLGILRELAVQGVHRAAPSLFLGRGRDREPLLAATRAFERLAEVHYISDRPLPAYFAGFRMLNVAETAGPSPELARAYSSMAAGLGFVPVHGMARSYFDRATALLADHGDLPTRAYVDFMLGFYLAGIGNWPEAIGILESTLGIAERLVDRRRHADALSLLAPARAFQGDVEGALRLADGLVAESRDAAYPRNLCEGLLLQGWLRLLAGQDEGAGTTLREYDAAVQALRVAEDGFLSLMARMVRLELALRRGEGEAALAVARDMLAIERKMKPNFFSALPAYAAVGDGLAAIRDRDLPGARAVTAADLKAAAAMAGRYTAVFPIGRPTVLRVRAHAARLRGAAGRAARLYRASGQEAARLGMALDRRKALDATARSGGAA